MGLLSDVQRTQRYVSFDRDVRVQVFEVTIRVLGGLLSGHMWATDRKRGFYLPWYEGQLLTLARDLGNRLLPAFASNASASGIPVARVHLQKGVLPYESIDTCTAGGGSLLLEFAALSRLTGDDVYERVAKKSFYALWNQVRIMLAYRITHAAIGPRPRRQRRQHECAVADAVQLSRRWGRQLLRVHDQVSRGAR